MDNVTALVPAQQTRALARPLEFSDAQRKMIRDTFANGASDEEFAVLMEVAKARGLNPLLRQIYFVKRYDSNKRCEVWSTQIAIDGLRAVAERTGIYAGQDEPEYVYEDKRLHLCKVRVYRKDWGDRPAVGVAYFGEYAQTKRDGGLTQFWATKPHIMLAKCAEALAIRKAFPEDTSGLYVPEEMGDAGAAPVVAESSSDEMKALGAAVAAAVEVKPEPTPPPPPPKRSPPPAYVLALWNKVLASKGGNKQLTQAEFQKAAEAIFGEPPKPSGEWTQDDCNRVEAAIFPGDVPF